MGKKINNIFTISARIVRYAYHERLFYCPLTLISRQATARPNQPGRHNFLTRASSQGVKIKLLLLFLLISSFIHAVDENFYMGGQSYYNFGSSYYPKYTNDYYWGGDGWIFKTGYKAPTERCCKRVKCTRACTWCRAYKKSLPDENLNNCCNGACRP